MKIFSCLTKQQTKKKSGWGREVNEKRREGEKKNNIIHEKAQIENMLASMYGGRGRGRENTTSSTSSLNSHLSIELLETHAKPTCEYRGENRLYSMVILQEKKSLKRVQPPFSNCTWKREKRPFKKKWFPDVGGAPFVHATYTHTHDMHHAEEGSATSCSHLSTVKPHSFLPPRERQEGVAKKKQQQQ